MGDAFKKPKALNELRLIASGPDDTNVFQVTNYSALDGLLSTLQQSIIGIEGKQKLFYFIAIFWGIRTHPISIALSGTQGDALEYELAQSGFSVQILDKASVLYLTLLNGCMFCCRFNTCKDSEGLIQEMMLIQKFENYVVKSHWQATACFEGVR